MSRLLSISSSPLSTILRSIMSIVSSFIGRYRDVCRKRFVPHASSALSTDVEYVRKNNLYVGKYFVSQTVPPTTVSQSTNIHIVYVSMFIRALPRTRRRLNIFTDRPGPVSLLYLNHTHDAPWRHTTAYMSGENITRVYTYGTIHVWTTSISRL